MDSRKTSVEKAIEYIEKNLNETLDLYKIAKVAAYSPYHFSRIFKQVTGENIKDMIKRLRLAQSTRELIYQDSSITNIGLNIGYETPSSFNKVFKQIFKMNPSEYKKKTEENLQKSFQKLQIEPAIIKIEENIYTYFKRSLGEYNDAATKAWNNLIQQGELNDDTIKLSNKRYFGLCYDNPKITEYDQMRYEPCISISADGKKTLSPKKIRILPKGEYAILKYNGDYDDLYDIWFQFYGWVYYKNLELDNFPPIEEYLDNPKDILNRKIVYNTTNLLLKIL